jgi:hypothetical protein
MLIRSLDALLNQGAGADLGIDGGGASSQCHYPHVILGLFFKFFAAFTTDIGARASRMQQPGACFGPDFNPSLVIEVGNNALQEQLRADAKHWLESPVVHPDVDLPPVSVSTFRHRTDFN